ncbi:MAG: hypothetical protein EHM70_02550 [Chloroflexota bacterium]|nr:MAG: hypothetical protein EHM70_02550 [Chloroflexota bacterium]
MIQNYPNPYAVVIGLDSIQGLQIARILADRKVPVIGLAGNLDYYTCSTRVCEQILEVDTSSGQLTDLLVDLETRLDQKAILFPCQEKNVLVVSRDRDRLAPWYHVILPDHELVERLVDKVSFYSFAQKEGFAIPRTSFLASRADAEQAAQSLIYPVVLKPTYRSDNWVSHNRQEALKVASA